ncbi:MAG: hypothetical protein H0V66_03415 [Bdellovibrionales bacterium]|nr:hypothetical protein [Bdellovibrionales bacterium]
MSHKYLFLLFLFIFSLSTSFAKTQIVELSQKVEFNTGDIITLKNSAFSVKIGTEPGTECAVPGFNCGSGYEPPAPSFMIDCGKQKSCPYVLMTDNKTATSGSLYIEDEKSCEKNDPTNCFNQFARNFKTDDGCRELKSPLGRYYCLKTFSHSARPENRGLCEQLPESIYALRWNCFYEHAIRYRDASFCDKYLANESSGRDRCLLQMAKILHDMSLCKKISASKEHSYLEQCLDLKK